MNLPKRQWFDPHHIKILQIFFHVVQITMDFDIGILRINKRQRVKPRLYALSYSKTKITLVVIDCS